MAREPDNRAVRALARKALAEGGSSASVIRVRWDVSGRCLSPVRVERYGRPLRRDGRRGYHVPMHGTPQWVEMEVPCRQCENCRKALRRLWRERITTELRKATRSWFGTLTFKPEQRLRLLSVARQRERKRRAQDFDVLSEAARFHALVGVCGAEVTRWLKRVRKERADRLGVVVPLRYCLVAEAHKDGFPHFHLVLHEPVPELTYTEECLRGQWRGKGLGFAEFRLVKEGPVAARYLTKYLVKDVRARVRASVAYGRS